MDMSRAHAYKSAQKIRMGKKQSVEAVSPNHGMSATIRDHIDSLPNVRGA